MEGFVLRCNYHSQARGYCRTKLREAAIVTTCSHVFCEPCAHESSFLNSPLAQRQCPVCKTLLSKTDDTARTVLRPSEEYKTSILSGLDPATIMECASRALSVWNYQNFYEAAFQKHLYGGLEQKHSRLNTEMDKLIVEANVELDGMNSKISALTTSNVELQQRTMNYATKDQERTKKFNDLRMMYDKLKQKYQSLVQPDAAATNAQRQAQSTSASLFPQRNSIDTAVRPDIPQSANGYFSARKQFEVAGSPFGKIHQQHQTTSAIYPYNVDNRMSMPPPMTFSNGQAISPHSHGPTAVQRQAFHSPLHPSPKRSHVITNNFQQRIQSSGAQWDLRNEQPHTNAPVSRQTSVVGYSGLTAGMKIGSAVTGDPLMHRFSSL